MRTIQILTACGVAFFFTLGIAAQEKPAIAPNDGPKESSPPAESPKSVSDELVQKFKSTMTKAVMSGRWCSIKDGMMGPSKEDKYKIESLSRLGGDSWIIHAHIQYGQHDIIAPIPIQVKWAGDTPVIVVDKLPIPGGGVYSARVLIYDHTYAGTWTGGDHGGLLNGVITNEPEEKAPEAK